MTFLSGVTRKIRNVEQPLFNSFNRDCHSFDMSRLFLCKIFFILLLFQKTFELDVDHLLTKKCDSKSSDQICSFTSLVLTAYASHFIIDTHHANRDIINTVTFKSSRIEILTRDYCEALPNIEFFHPSSLGLKSVDEDALKKCKFLQRLDLSFNLLTVLSDTLFLNNEALSELSLNYNQFTQIYINLFANNPLEKLYMGGNLISDFNEMPIAPELTEVSLVKNQLSDLNVGRVVDNFPKLQLIYIFYNRISCEREKEIHKQFLSNRIDCRITQKCLVAQDLTRTTTTITPRRQGSTTRLMKRNTTVTVPKQTRPTKAASVPQTTAIATKESDDDIKKRITDLQEQHQVTNLVIIIIATILVLLIVGLGVGWIVRRSRTSPVVPLAPVAPVEEIKLEEMDYINGDVGGSDKAKKIEESYYEKVQFDFDFSEDEDGYDHLNFNRFR